MVSENKSLVALRGAFLREVGEEPARTAPNANGGGAAPVTQPSETPDSVAFHQVYELLRRVARTHMGDERGVRSFRATDLLHDAWLQLGGRTFANREEACAYVTVAIRHLLVDAARRRTAEKRGGGWGRVSLDEAESNAAGRGHTLELLDLDTAMRALDIADPRAAKVVELRYFGGMTNDQIATALKVSERTVRTDYANGIAWLKQRVASGSASGSTPQASS